MLLLRDEVFGLDATGGRDTVPLDDLLDLVDPVPERAVDPAFPLPGEAPAGRTGSATITMPFEDGRETTGPVRVFPGLASER